ncbi:MAG: glycosyl transferase family 2, partial [Cyanobacteria bacterium P01_D01_bin.2]
FCLEGYRFSQRPALEAIRKEKLSGLKQVLAMRLIEKGDAQQGRQLIRELATSGPLSAKAKLGRVLSYLPLGLRQLAFQGFRQLRPQDYSERVRNATG